MTRTPLSRSKAQRHQAALLTAAFTHQAAAAVTAGTYPPTWEHTASLRSGAVGLAALRRRQRRAAGHMVASPAQLVKFTAGLVQILSAKI